MKPEVEAAMKVLVAKASADSVKSDDAQRFAQAALNLAHVLATLHGMTSQ